MHFVDQVVVMRALKKRYYLFHCTGRTNENLVGTKEYVERGMQEQTPHPLQWRQIQSFNRLQVCSRLIIKIKRLYRCYQVEHFHSQLYHLRDRLSLNH